jgi:excisionase family DNA binding protein
MPTGTVRNRNWWTRKEAAAELEIHPETLDEWCKRGAISATQPGGPGTQVRFAKEDVERVKQRERGAA